MKTKLCVLIFLLAVAVAPAQTNNLTALLQQGLLEEQANQNLDAAIASYQLLATQFDKDRQLAATAVFRIGECYRMQGKTNEAAAQYQRVLKDFSDQNTLATMSRQNLTGMGTSVAAPMMNDNADAKLWSRLEKMDKAQVEKILPTLVRDAVLDSLLQQRNEAQTKLVQLQVDYADTHTVVLSQKALLGEVNRQIDEKISGMMQGLKLRADISKTSLAPINGQSSSDASTDEEEQEIRRIQQMIQNSPDLINAPGEGGSTPLRRAAAAGWIKVATYLLDHGADVNAGEITALNDAAKAGNRAMVELLLSRGAEVNKKNSSYDGQTPLHIAAAKNFQAVVEVLLANKADVNIQDASGNTPLRLAASNGQTKVVKLLLAAAANPNIQNKEGKTPLSAAAGRGLVEMTGLLLAAGANPNVEIDLGQTPLSFAAGSGSPETVKLLLDAKADPNGGKLDAPLLQAINARDVSSAELLLQAGANPNIKGVADFSIPNSGSGVTPLYVAVSTKQLPMVQLLLKYKADPNDSQVFGQPLLFGALSDTNILETLLDAGAKVDARYAMAPVSNGNGLSWTPLIYAVQDNRSADVVEILLKHGANPNLQDEGYGQTPLIWSTGWGSQRWPNADVLKLLLDYKADPNIRDFGGRTLLSNLKQKSKDVSPGDQITFSKLADLLRQHGALDNLPDWDHITVSRPSANFSQPVFQKGTNDWNRFTLLETILNFYQPHAPTQPAGNFQERLRLIINRTAGAYSGNLKFPDLTQIIVVRHSHSSTNETRIKINLLNSTNGIDCSKDISLEFGDIVEISERDHALGDLAVGLTGAEVESIADYLKGSVKLVTHDQKVELPIYPSLDGSDIGFIVQQPEAQKLLLSSSDLSRVKVIRRDAKTGKNREWIVDCTGAVDSRNGYNAPDLWLRDGDVIEVPEKQ